MLNREEVIDIYTIIDLHFDIHTHPLIFFLPVIVIN